MTSTIKRTQRDYSLAFKLAEATKLKKANSLTHKPKTIMVFKAVPPF